MPARTVALHALREWRKKARFADVIIQDLPARDSLGESDRAFARELFYGVLRNLRALDFWIGLLRKGKVDDSARDLLRLGLYQLFLLHTPAHAAINETVALAETKRRSLINAVLRSAQRDEIELRRKLEAESVGVRLSHPDFLLARWEKNFGTEAAVSLADWNNRPPPVYARINCLKTAPDEWFAAHPQFRKLPGRPDFAELTRVPADALAAGLFYIQDPSTTIACDMLGAQAGERILDACAAPGGKTSLLAQQMNNRGSIVACDRDALRLVRLQENLARLGVENVTTIQHDWTRKRGGAEFDRILVDAPCSNTGVMRRRVDVRWRLQPVDFARMQERQLAIARNVLASLKPNGILVYSTCSLEPEENDEVIAQLLKEFADLKLVEKRFVTPFADGFDGAFAAKFHRLR